MSLEKFGNKIKRELIRNKAKSAALGLMCLVALYFWAPLVGGWFATTSGDSSLDTTPSETVVVLPQPNVPNKQTDENGNQYDWKRLRAWMQKDPRMASAALMEGLLDPFRRPEPAETLTEEEEDPAPARDTSQPISVTPDQLGLVLQSTMIGRRNRVAKINGARYQERSKLEFAVRHGDENEGVERVEATSLNQAVAPIEFELAEVHRDHVVLTRDGDTFSLQLDRPKFGRQQALFQRADEPVN